MWILEIKKVVSDYSSPTRDKRWFGGAPWEILPRAQTDFGNATDRTNAQV